ncbi:MAG: FAD/FMN-containing dehydrogenase/Fe-S oxidoreductase [Candidatus Nitrosomirales archaeon]|jgi:FAD/FMN-containing dehydrogenase/Fe-S oxidoreductase
MNPEIIAKSLKQQIVGDVLFDEWQRCMYATDASAYEIMPKCVVLPKNTDDVIKVVKFAYDNNLAVIARGGGTGLAGQAVGDGIIIDFTKYMNKILEINEKENYVVVEPGIYKGILDVELNKHGKFLPPDPSSANYCALGGMIATNASGAHTVKYGSTIDYVLSLDVVLSNGDLIHTKPLTIGSDEWNNAAKSDSVESRLYGTLANILRPNEELITNRFPKVRKNSCGYRLDRVLHDNVLDVGKIFVASEGTLGIVVKARFRIMDMPKHKALTLLGFNNTLEAAKSIQTISELKPSALELLDRTVIELARTASEDFALKVPTGTNCLVFAEFDGNDLQQVNDSINSLLKTLEQINATCIAHSFDPQEINVLWGIRKNALAYTMKIRSDNKKPVAFMEDPVVSVDKLGFLVDKLQEVYAKHGLSYVIYGHAGDGNLHTRPLLDVGKSEDREIMKQITSDLLTVITSVNGSISAEHGDGLARSEFIKDVYGNEIYQLFIKVKELFDPKNILNPNKKVTVQGTFVKNFRYGYERREQKNVLNWQLSDSKITTKITGYNTELSYSSEVDLCHGCGSCREQNFGLRMCPVYKGLNDEVSSCRGRNNVLRWLSKVDGLSKEFALTEEYRDVIYKYCIQCKMCLVDCPSNVNVGKSMAEARAAYAKVKGLPKGYEYFVNIDKHASQGCKLAPLSNFLMNNKLFRTILESKTGIDARKRFPKFSKKTFDRVFQDYMHNSKTSFSKHVAFFCDTYVRYVDPMLGIRMVKMLQKNGYDVIFPEQMSSGLPALLEGAPDVGRNIAEYNVKSLYQYASQGIPVICFSPSSSIALKMDYLNVLDNEQTRTVAANTYDIHEFLSNLYRKNELDTNFQHIDEDVGIHFHCHTIVQGVDKHVLNLLKLIPKLKYHVVEKGCCGVGGSYSFIKENYDLSMQIGKELFNLVKQEKKVYTTGESCMLQIEEGSNRKLGLTIDLISRAYGMDR